MNQNNNQEFTHNLVSIILGALIGFLISFITINLEYKLKESEEKFHLLSAIDTEIKIIEAELNLRLPFLQEELNKIHLSTDPVNSPFISPLSIEAYKQLLLSGKTWIIFKDINTISQLFSCYFAINDLNGKIAWYTNFATVGAVTFGAGTVGANNKFPVNLNVYYGILIKDINSCLLNIKKFSIGLDLLKADKEFKKYQCIAKWLSIFAIVLSAMLLVVLFLVAIRFLKRLVRMYLKGA